MGRITGVFIYRKYLWEKYINEYMVFRFFRFNFYSRFDSNRVLE